MTTIEATTADERVLAHAAGVLLATGPPGSGKTRSLLERVARLIEAGAQPERVGLVVLNRRAARAARELLLHRLARSLPELNVATAHSLAFRVLGRRYAELEYAEPPQVLSAAEQYATVRELLTGESPADWPRLGGLLRVPGFAREVADFVLRAQERLLGPEELSSIAARGGTPGHAEVAAFYGRYLDVMGQANRVDFAGLLAQATAVLQRGLSADDRLDHLLVDDYQDVTPASESIIAALARAATSVVVTADPGGHVFSYRGGSLEPLSRIGETLRPAERVALAGGRLAQGALVALDDPERSGMPAGSGEETARVTAAKFVHPGEEADAIAHALLRARVEDEVPWERMAVIVRRYGEYLTALRHALARHGIPSVVVGEASAVAREPANRPIIDLFGYALRPSAREDLLEPVLSSRAGGFDPHGLRALRREARRRGVSLMQLVHDEPTDAMPPGLRDRVDDFRTLVAGLSERVHTERPDDVFFWVWSRLAYVRELVSAEQQRDLDALSALAEIISRFAERRPSARIADYLETLDAAEFGPDPWVLPEERRPHAVRVVSAHRAHGLSFDVVCVAGCVEGEFPAPGRSRSLVDLDHMLAPRTAVERARDALAEERRLFRLAVSRARVRTFLTASESASVSRPRTPSRFAGRLGLDWTPAGPGDGPGDGDGGATSLRRLSSDLRRVVADPAAPAPERLAALAALPRTGVDPRAWWGRRERTDPGGSLYADELKTSYSRLSAMENCALQYLYQVEMGLDPDPSFQMWVGAAVHDIIDRAQRGEIPRTEEAVLLALEELWNPNVFPNRAIEHRRHLDARDMLERWIRGEQATVEHSEVAFSYPLGDAVIRGKIDAIFRQSNHHLRLVDYKTGRWAPTKDEVKEDLQLAAYFLAVQRDEHLRTLGKVGYLQLSYIGKARYEGFAAPGFTPPDGYAEWAERTITELVGRIRAERFAPSPEADCQWCAFRTICPMWPEGGEAVR